MERTRSRTGHLRLSWRLAAAAVLSFALIAAAEAKQTAKKRAGAPDYSGVTLRGGDPPAPKAPPPGMQFVNWPGFRVAKGTGDTRIFLQMSGPVTYKLRKSARRVYLTLYKAQVYLRNNLLPVLTEHFGGPVKRFKLRELRGGRLRLEVRLKAAVSAEVSQSTVGQYTYLVLNLVPRRR